MTRGQRVVSKRQKGCSVCGATGNEIHHPACPYGITFTVSNDELLYCDECGDRWNVWHACGGKK